MKMKTKMWVAIFIMIIIIISFLIFYTKNTSVNYNNSTFEARIGEELIFKNEDILLMKDTEIEKCIKLQEGYDCSFYLEIEINEEASKKYSNTLSNLDVDYSNPSCVELDKRGEITKLYLLEDKNSPCSATKQFYFNEMINYYLDGELISYYRIREKQKEDTKQLLIRILINGETTEEAYNKTEAIRNTIQNIRIN